MPTRRWWQFSLRTLLGVMLVAALGLGWWAEKVRREQRHQEALRLLALCPDPTGTSYTPVAVIQAVNYLHSLGREEALGVLRRAEAERPVGNKHQSLRLVIPLLFDRKQPEDKYPESGSTDDEYELTLENWNNWILVEQDIPFHMRIIVVSGRPRINTYLLHWAEREGRFRDSPLRPADDPCAAADQVCDQSSSSKSEREQARDVLPLWVRGQTLDALAPLLAASGFNLEGPVPGHDPRWDSLHQECLNRGIHWSEREQNYAFSGPNPPKSRP